MSNLNSNPLSEQELSEIHGGGSHIDAQGRVHGDPVVQDWVLLPPLPPAPPGVYVPPDPPNVLRVDLSVFAKS